MFRQRELFVVAALVIVVVGAWADGNFPTCDNQCRMRIDECFCNGSGTGCVDCARYVYTTCLFCQPGINSVCVVDAPVILLTNCNGTGVQQGYFKYDLCTNSCDCHKAGGGVYFGVEGNMTGNVNGNGMVERSTCTN
jgi:hypothetical protein